jgi:hypothetical protein
MNKRILNIINKKIYKTISKNIYKNRLKNVLLSDNIIQLVETNYKIYHNCSQTGNKKEQPKRYVQLPYIYQSSI